MTFFWSRNTDGYEIKTLIKNYNFVGSNSTTKFFNIDKTTISYVTCTNEKSVINCTVALETLTFDNAIYEESCEFTLKTTREIVSQVSVKILSKTKVVVDWLERENLFDKTNEVHLNLLLVNFPSCSIQNIEKIVYSKEYDEFIVNEVKYYQIIGNRDNFEVVHLNEHLEFNKLIFNSDACETNNFTMLPQYSAAETLEIYPVNGYFDKTDDLVVIYNGDSIDVSLNFLDASNIKVVQFDNRTRSVITSTSNRMIGLCSSFEYDWKTVNCLQYDSDVSKLLETSVHFGHPVETILIYNASKGGLLVITKRKSVFSRSSYFFTIKKVDAKHKYKSLKIIGYECDARSIQIKDVFENDKREYCLTLHCQKIEDSFIVKCFSDDLVSVPVRKIFHE